MNKPTKTDEYTVFQSLCIIIIGGGLIIICPILLLLVSYKSQWNRESESGES